MNDNSLVSIVMCCYNGSHFIDRSFNSILEQTYPNIELIFINDGSTDDSVVHAETYRVYFEKRGYQLHIFSQENQGLGYASMNGVQKAKGEYLTYFDVDDYLMPDSILLKVDFLKTHPDYDVVRTNGYEVFEDDLDDKSRPLVKTDKEKKESHIFKDLLFGYTNNWAGTYLIRLNPLKEFYQGKVMPGSKYGQNLQLLLPLTRSKKAGFIDVPLMKYIRNNQSHTITNNSFEKRIELVRGYFDIRFIMLDLMEVVDRKILRNLNKRYFRTILDICMELHERDGFNYYYTELRRTIGNVDIETKMDYASMNNRNILFFFYRILFFISRKLSLNR